MGMYAKLMSRITESSLMEEEISVRYCFMMLLAIADPKGYVVGTDVAIARRMNLPLQEFKDCIAELMKPDPDSNSKEQEGRRVIDSDCERGYYLVNYTKYRDTRDEEQRREYMRDYMRKYRNPNGVAHVNNCKQDKPPLAKEEAEEKEEVKGEASTRARTNGKTFQDGLHSDRVPTTPKSKRIAAIFHRRESTPWTSREVRAYLDIGEINEDDLSAVERYYAANWPPTRQVNILRTDLLTFLNNFPGEVGRAHAANLKPAVDYSAQKPGRV